MSYDKDLMKNGEGYSDPTAYEAIKNTECDDNCKSDDGGNTRFHKLLDTIFNICDLSGFHLEGRITVRDKKTGKIWK